MVSGVTCTTRVNVWTSTRFAQRGFDKLANLFAHAGNYSVAHFADQHARLAVKVTALDCVEQQVSHFG